MAPTGLGSPFFAILTASNFPRRNVVMTRAISVLTVAIFAVALAIVAGKSRDSLLFKHITHQREPHMPKDGPKLSEAAIARIASWIDLGAPYDGPMIAGKPKKQPWTQRVVPAEAKEFWAFRPLTN